VELKRSKGQLIVGSALLIFGVIVFEVFNLHGLGGGVFIAGLTLILIGLYWARKPKTELPDERYKRIWEKAGYNAFWITIGTITIIVLRDLYFPGRFRTIDIYELTMLVGICSFFIFRFYYDKKGFK
jgi:uncharacterized membrane protein